jgi:hypothetical protein
VRAGSSNERSNALVAGAITLFSACSGAASAASCGRNTPTPEVGVLPCPGGRALSEAGVEAQDVVDSQCSRWLVLFFQEVKPLNGNDNGIG